MVNIKDQNLEERMLTDWNTLLDEHNVHTMCFDKDLDIEVIGIFEQDQIWKITDRDDDIVIFQRNVINRSN